MRQLRALLAASFSICFLLTAIATAQDRALQLGTPIERDLGNDQTHAFTVTVQENQFVQLVVEQRGIDVTVSVASPAGKNVGTFDSPNGDNGPENVSFVAAEAGIYRISVAPLNPGEVPAGKYEIKLVELRQATEQEIKNSKNVEIVKAKGIALLSDVDGLIPEIHSTPTRVRAQMQASQLLWDSDEKAARKYLDDAMAGVKEFVSNVDPTVEDYQRNYATIAQLRYELVQLVAGRDPELAMNFLYASRVPPSPYNNPREQQNQERGLELFIADQIASKDPKRASQMARESLKKGYSQNLIGTISNVRTKEPELAAQLASEVATKVLGEDLLKQYDAASITPSLMNFCNSTRVSVHSRNGRVGQSEQVLPEATCHDLKQKLYDEAMSYTPPPFNAYGSRRDAAWNMLTALQSVGPDLDNTIPGAVAAVQKKFSELNGNGNPYAETMRELQLKLDSGQADNALESIKKVPEEMKEQSYIQLANILGAKGDGARARQIINDYITNPFQKRQALASLEQQDMYQSMQRGKVEEALRIVANARTPRERASLLSQIVRQIGPGQKRATALSFLEQARGMLAPAPQAQDQEQMNALLQLSQAFSKYDAKRAFEIVDPLVEQLNDLCTASRTLEGFGSENYFEDELDIQAGNTIANLVIQMSNTLGLLATTNFERAKMTSDRLKLPEVRLRAYLQIAQTTIQPPGR